MRRFKLLSWPWLQLIQKYWTIVLNVGDIIILHLFIIFFLPFDFLEILKKLKIICLYEIIKLQTIGIIAIITTYSNILLSNPIMLNYNGLYWVSLILSGIM